MSRPVAIPVGAALIFASTGLLAAELKSERFDSFRDMHLNTSYGELFFNESAIRVDGPRGSRQLKRFVPIAGNGKLNLPDQNGYCFVINHFLGEGGEEIERRFRVTVSKTLLNGAITEEIVDKPYTPTNDPLSSRVPDICITGIANAMKVTLRFSSTHNASFDREVSFEL